MNAGITKEGVTVSFEPLEAVKFALTHPIYSAKVKFLTQQIDSFQKLVKSKYPESLLYLNCQIQEGKIEAYSNEDCKYNAANFLKVATSEAELVSKYKEDLQGVIASKIESTLKSKNSILLKILPFLTFAAGFLLAWVIEVFTK